VSSKRQVRRQSRTDKVGHPDAQSAQAHLEELYRSDPNYKGAVYRCHFCGQYHVGRPSRTLMIGRMGSRSNNVNRWKR
jgi:hypothetical protein